MGFGQQLNQLAQGIIANERQRKQMEARQEAQDIQIKQAERTFRLRQQEVRAREGFLDLQTKQLKQKVLEESSPEATRKKKLELDFLEERIKSMRAERERKGKGESKGPTISEQLRLGQEHDRINKEAQTARTDLTIRNMLDGESVPGIDSDAVLQGIEDAGVRSWEGLNAAIESSQKEIRALESNPRVVGTLLEPRLKALTEKRDALIQAQAELRKIHDRPTTGDEFRAAAPDSFPDSFTAELFENGSSVEARKRNIWGDGLFSQGRQKMLDIAIEDIRQGNTQTLRGFIQMLPGSLLDNDGRLSIEGQKQLAGYFNVEGVPVDTGIRFVNEFNKRGGLGAP